MWCGIMREEEAIQSVRVNVHSPGPIRYDVAATVTVLILNDQKSASSLFSVC